jgi:hypothetical protein
LEDEEKSDVDICEEDFAILNDNDSITDVGAVKKFHSIFPA